MVWQESERAVTKKEGIDFAREYGCLFLECSAKTKVNVEQCFEELVLKVCVCRDSFQLSVGSLSGMVVLLRTAPQTVVDASRCVRLVTCGMLVSVCVKKRTSIN